MTTKNLEVFSTAHAKAIAHPTTRNLLEAAKDALVLAANANDVQGAWLWWAPATDLASTGGVNFQSVNSKYPPTWIALRQVQEALNMLPDEPPRDNRLGFFRTLAQALITWEQTGTTKDALLAARAALNMTYLTDVGWMAWSWTELADGLASYAGIELSSLGFAVCPDVVGGISDVEKALAKLSQKGTSDTKQESKTASLKAGLRVLNAINGLDPTGDQWQQCTLAERMCSTGGVPIWDALGINYFPALENAKGIIEEAISSLVQEETKVYYTDEDQEQAENDPELDQPSMLAITQWIRDGICEAACPERCLVEPDGHCQHGKPSWLLVKGFI